MTAAKHSRKCHECMCDHDDCTKLGSHDDKV